MKRTSKICLGVGVAVVVLAPGVIGYSATCPCNRTPGLLLFGDTHEAPVADWSFANDVPLCQIQVWTRLGPRAMNLNCMATPEGELYLSCSTGTNKYWCGQVEPNDAARLRLNGVVYPVVLNRVTDQTTLERAWAARVKKLQVHGEPPVNPKPPLDANRPDTWWSCSVSSR